MEMRDLFLGIFLIAATYVGCAAFAVTLFRIFFPLKTKVAGQEKLTYSHSINRESSSTKNKVHLLSMRGRSDWIKANT
jgi:hypothetical protein